jgi:hypothetical protein
MSDEDENYCKACGTDHSATEKLINDLIRQRDNSRSVSRSVQAQMGICARMWNEAFERKDAEIARLKARIAELEQQDPSLEAWDGKGKYPGGF